jgi:hypothetical protein
MEKDVPTHGKNCEDNNGTTHSDSRLLNPNGLAEGLTASDAATSTGSEDHEQHTPMPKTKALFRLKQQYDNGLIPNCQGPAIARYYYARKQLRKHGLLPRSNYGELVHCSGKEKAQRRYEYYQRWRARHGLQPTNRDADAKISGKDAMISSENTALSKAQSAV